jgi:hypothetical protein
MEVADGSELVVGHAPPPPAMPTEEASSIVPVDAGTEGGCDTRVAAQDP